jgi:hypothetical protein
MDGVRGAYQWREQDRCFIGVLGTCNLSAKWALVGYADA